MSSVNMEQDRITAPAVEAAAAAAEVEPHRPWLWPKGQSGNPAGRPKGARNRATLWLEALEEGDVASVMGGILAEAKKGDRVASRFLAARLLAPATHRRVPIDLPEAVEAVLERGACSVKAAAAMMSAVLRATFAGDLAPAEAQVLFRLIERRAAIVDDADDRAEDEGETTTIAAAGASGAAASVNSSVLADRRGPAAAKVAALAAG